MACTEVHVLQVTTSLLTTTVHVHVYGSDRFTFSVCVPTCMCVHITNLHSHTVKQEIW